MSVLTLFTRTAPTIGGVEFDAILEDVFEMEVSVTQFPIESGASATDHRIIRPFRWSLIGAVSNNPLKTSVTDFTGLLTNLAGDNGILSTIAGMSAGLLAGSDDTRASQTLQFLIALAATGEPFDIDAGDVQLSNMVIAGIRRRKTPENEQGLLFEAQLIELPTLDTLMSDRTVKQSQLADGDSSKWSIASLIDKGEQALTDVSDSVKSTVSNVMRAL